MYLVPLIVLVVIALIATVWTPIFGAGIFVVGFALFLVYVGLSRRSDQEATAPRHDFAKTAELAPGSGCAKAAR